jgi:hypothetical protein
MTDAILSATTSQAAISGALKRASATTGVGFDYLYRVALRESSLNPEAKATTSSAAGLFQFIEQTWLHAVKKYGAAHGLADFAAEITTRPNGRLAVADETRRKEILDLRFDPEKAAALAAELARENKTALVKGLGRAVDAAQLYAAHFLGAGGATKLLSASSTANAAALLPAAADANRNVFFDGARARSVGEVIDGFRRTIGEAQGAIRQIGAHVEKSLAPLLRETATISAPFERVAASLRPSGAEFEIKGLSPLVLALLQAMDPTDIARPETPVRRLRE